MKMRLILLLPLALLALKGNLNATPIVNYGTDGDDTQTEFGTPGPATYLQYGRGGNDTHSCLLKKRQYKCTRRLGK